MPGVDLYRTTFDRIEADLARTGPDWLHDRRRAAIESFVSRGFPSLRDEEWRFTRTKPIQEREFSLQEKHEPNGFGADQLQEATFDDSGCHRIVLINGHYDASLSRVDTLPDGVRVSHLSDALAQTPELIEPHLGKYATDDGDPFVALNTAFVREGVFVHVDAGVVVADPIHIVTASTRDNVMSHPRILVLAGDNTQFTVVESYIGSASEYFTNVVTEIVCGENANVTHCKLQQEHESAFHIANQHASLSANCTFSTESISLGGSLVRNNISSLLDGEGIDCRVDGLYLANHRQHVDNHTYIRHAKPNCHSFELYKGILDGRARGVFNGKIFVDPDAQKTDAKQQNNCILLSDDARINTNPQLEIFADDVKCTHGATVGQLDENAVFYMRSRGIPEARARQVLVYAFAAEVVERVGVDALREQLEVELFWWLSKTIAG